MAVSHANPITGATVYLSLADAGSTYPDGDRAVGPGAPDAAAVALADKNE